MSKIEYFVRNNFDLNKNGMNRNAKIVYVQSKRKKKPIE